MQTSTLNSDGSEMEHLLGIVQALSLAQSLEEVVDITRKSARQLTQADGATFILRDGELCHYKDEDAIAPLWKGRRFPMVNCVSGWTMMNKATAIIPDIYKDDRVPIEAYRPTFVKSMIMVPIRKKDPMGAIGNYWSTERAPTEKEIRLLEALADSTAIAMENVRLINELKKANETLEQSLNSCDEFLSIASHELKTPLTALLLRLQTAQRTLDKKENLEPQKMSQYVDQSLKQAFALETLVERLMDVSRIQLNLLKLNYTRQNLSNVLTECVGRLMPAFAQAKCKVNLEIDSDIEAECDQSAFEQVVTNLSSNVVKYAPGTEVKISLRKPEHGIITLSVEDNGAGIPAEMHSKIFERFGRAIGYHNVSGFGLGLFIAKNFIEAHGGRIWVESAQGKGAKFTVELPCLKRS